MTESQPTTTGEHPPTSPKSNNARLHTAIADFNQTITSFLQCCLCKDPDKRWTAAKLLTHDFIKHPGAGTRLEPFAEDHRQPVPTLLELLGEDGSTIVITLGGKTTHKHQHLE
eukprot:TRINITY_DN31030_c0_g1_i1.p2 TRINITY_DN31030_c0_g1~~TRINITY_DN31030_c0_g1_i1.p2  ORF type:complete len:120 (-),score=20.92 TRINITY_DN31030_c0_g1_i1:141-479(-)